MYTTEMIKKSFIEAQIYNGGKDEIINFIADIRYHCGIKGQETIRRLFRSGYCYYFANMLKNAFAGGSIKCIPDAGHIVFEYNDVLYDIEGVYDSGDLKVSDIDDTDISAFLHKKVANN